MAAPNMINLTYITGNTTVVAVGTTATSVVANPAASNRVIKISSLIISNIDGVNAADITVDVFRSSVAYRIASTITVPADASLVVISRDNAVYLEEGDTLRCTASAAGDLEAICSFENMG